MKSKFWLVRFVYDFDDGAEIVHQAQVFVFQQGVNKKLVEAFASQHQSGLFRSWREQEQDVDEPCANDGTHRKSSHGGTLCVHWMDVVPVDAEFKQAMVRANLPVKTFE